MLRRVPVLLPVLALGAATAVLLPTAGATAAPAETTGKTYVAMGDSYAAGFGLPPGEGTLTGQPVPGCAQTTGDYPRLMAADLGLVITDVTCSGARTRDFQNSQTGAGAAPQDSVFATVQPDLVTITIGGNDLGFAAISADCLAASKDGPVFSHPSYASCTAYYADTSRGGGAASDPTKRLPTTLTAVDAAVKDVKAKAPNAKIAIIAYPAIAPDVANTPAGGCYAANATPVAIPLPGLPISVNSTFPFTDTDVPFLQQLQQQLDEGIAQVAADNQVAYADIYPSSLAHSACAPVGTRWVEPIIPAKFAQGATNTLHPNLLGTTAMTNTLAPVVTGLFAPPATSPAPSSGAPTTGGTTSGPVRTGGPVPLADTGVDVPVSWLLGLAGALLVAGGGAMAAVRRRPVSRH